MVGVRLFLYNKQMNAVLMTKRKDSNLYGVPGGKLEFGESF